MNAKYYTYRNLNKKDLFSTKHKGLVQDRFSIGELTDVTFKVSKAGNKRAKLERKRNVHAFVVSDNKVSIKNPIDTSNLAKVRYNPFENDKFTVNGKVINHAKRVLFQNGSLFVIEE